METVPMLQSLKSPDNSNQIYNFCNFLLGCVYSSCVTKEQVKILDIGRVKSSVYPGE